jgi:hypothetical protein
LRTPLSVLTPVENRASRTGATGPEFDRRQQSERLSHGSNIVSGVRISSSSIWSTTSVVSADSALVLSQATARACRA